MNSFKEEEDPYADNYGKVVDITYAEAWYGSFVMGALILGMAVYFIKIKRWQRFEWTIILCMFLKYAMNPISTTNAYNEWMETSKMHVLVIRSVWPCLGPIYHWIYASQYLKTCLLTRGILRRAILLFKRNKTIVD